MSIVCIIKLVASAVMMEAASISETSVNFYCTSWRNNPEDRATFKFAAMRISDFRNLHFVRSSQIDRTVILAAIFNLFGAGSWLP
jgi:hypothetical protein